MADNILKLRVESSEYDQKLANAAKGIRHLAEVAHQSGGDLTGLEKAELDYVKALGEMETKSRTAAGSVRELGSTYKELKVIYDQLNDVEKADEGGKALAASLEQIKQRAQEARAQLDNASKSLSDNGQEAQQSSGILDALASKFTINIDAIKLFNIGLQAAKGALDVAKDAFMSSEANVDEWGRIVDSSKSLYEGFLTALNTGDISGYLSRIDSIVQAARTAYNELDRLGTMKTIQAPQMSAQQTENERIRSMIQTGRYIAPIDGRRNAVFNGREMQSGDKLTAGQIRALEKQLQNGMQNVVKLVGNEVKQTGKAIDAVYNRQAKELGLSLSEFRKGTSSMAEFDKRMKGYDDYQKWREQHTTIDLQSGRETVARGNPFEQFAKWGTFRVDGQRYNDLVRLIQQRDQQAGQAYGMQSQSYRAMNRAEGFTVSKLMKGDTTKSSKSTTIKEDKDDFTEVIGLIGMAEERVSDLQKQIRESWDQNEIVNLRKKLQDAQNELDVLQGKLPKDTVVDITVDVDTAKALQKIGDIEGVTIAPKTVEITATDEALPLLREIEGVTINPKTFSITATDEALPLLRDIEGVTIEPKNMTVTADTTEALKRVQELIAQVNGTVVGIKVEPVITDEDIERSLREQYGKPIEVPVVPKTAGEALEQEIRIKLAQQNIDADMQTLRTLLEVQIKNGIEGIDIPKDMLINQIRGEGIPDEYWQKLQDQINEKLKEMDIDPIKINFKTGNIANVGKETEKSWRGAASAMSAAGSALQGLEDPGAKIAGIVGQAIANIALGFSQATTVTGAGGIFAWIAAIAGGLTTMLSTISAIHSATGYAQGGIVDGRGGGFVGGMAYSGDNIGNVRLDSGELVLNRSQQNNLANALEGGNALQNLRLDAVIRGEQIRLVLNNNGRRTGRGEYVQTNRR